MLSIVDPKLRPNPILPRNWANLHIHHSGAGAPRRTQMVKGLPVGLIQFTAEQLCFLSRVDKHRSISKGTHIPNHGIQDGQELPHASHKSHLLQFALAQ